jgi:hypothetical protein
MTQKERMVKIRQIAGWLERTIVFFRQRSNRKRPCRDHEYIREELHKRRVAQQTDDRSVF